MNILPLDKRIQILNMLVEGSSLRATSRVAGVAFNTVLKLLVDAGQACERIHDELVRDVHSQRVQADEIVSFLYVKQKNLQDAVAAPDKAGTVWTWTAIDAETKLIISWHVSETRDVEPATQFMLDLSSRLANRIQLTTDGHIPYIEAVARAFGTNVDFAQNIKGQKETRVGVPDEEHIGTSYMERHNLTTRMSLRRYTRRTNAFSKKFENHRYALALYFVWYNFCRPHMSLYGNTPAMAAGLAEYRYDFEWILKFV